MCNWLSRKNLAPVCSAPKKQKLDQRLATVEDEMTDDEADLYEVGDQGTGYEQSEQK